MRLSTWIAGIFTAAITIWFALANRSFVRLSFDPFALDEPRWAVAVPIFMVVFLGVFVGMLAGGLIVWWGQGHWRREARRTRREITRLSANQGDTE